MRWQIVAGLAAQAHHGTIVLSVPMVSWKDGRPAAPAPSLFHPFERMGMDLAPPVAFSVTHDG